jgi:PhzF family phenazine biosynthesis protein
MRGTDTTIVRACTRHGRGGSPTAVLNDDATLTDGARRAIVRRAGASHAAFIDTGTEPAPTVRFFTAHGELTNCGHGTIAAQAVLLDRRRTNEHRARQRTGGRTFATTAVRRADGIEVWFDQGTVELQDCPAIERDGILAALGIRPSDTAPDDDPCIASPGTPRLLVPVRNRPALLSLRPDLDRLAAVCRRRGYLGCFVYVLPSTHQAAAARMFAPAIGVGEDVANANSAGCLAAYLLATHGNTSIEVEQGDALGHPSSVFATAVPTEGGITTRVGGLAAIPPGSNVNPQRGRFARPHGDLRPWRGLRPERMRGLRTGTPEVSHMPTTTDGHEVEARMSDRMQRATEERRKGVRGLVVSAVVLAGMLALWWLVATTNSEGDHDAQLLPLVTLIPLVPALFHLYRSRVHR